MSSAPAYGRRLVPQVLDELAISDPGRVYAAIPKTADVKDGYRDVTVADLAACANFMARWIEDRFGRSDGFETITYVGLSDLKGMALLLGAIKTGYKVCGWGLSYLVGKREVLSKHSYLPLPLAFQLRPLRI